MQLYSTSQENMGTVELEYSIANKSISANFELVSNGLFVFIY